MAQTAKKWTDEQIQVGIRLHDDFEYYAENALRIKPKAGNEEAKQNQGLIPFRFNTAQKYLDYILKKQLAKIGKVRAWIVKGRQQGCSTWIEGRYFHKTSMNYGKKTFIQTHSDEATTNLYRIAKRYLNNLPDDIKPHVGTSNRRELIFDELDSGYRVSTAGSRETGRSDTVDYLHNSEVAFQRNALEHAAGLLQAVPDAPDTWIIHESTANGMGGYFHKGYTSAKAGMNGDYIAIFIPWYWQDEYRKPVPEGFKLTEEELDYIELYDRFPVFDNHGNLTFIKKKLDLQQMVWRRDKIAEFEGSVSKFNQEYPATDVMAFQYSATDSFISAESVLQAIKRKPYKSYGAIVAGFDPSFTAEGDRKAFIYRQGANMWGLEYPKLDDHDAQVAYLKRKLDGNIHIDKLFIDSGGGGYAIYQCLDRDGYSDRVEIVNSAKKAEEDYKYANKRAEMSDRLKKALNDNDMPLSIQIDDDLQQPFITDMTAEGWTEDRNNRLLIEKKEDVKSRLGISPEGKDVAGLTYARNIIRKHVMGRPRQTKAINNRKRYRV